MTQQTAATTDSFTGELQSVMIGNVRSVTKYAIDEDNKGGTIWVEKVGDGLRPNLFGNELIKIKIEYDLYDALKRRVTEGELVCPGMWEMLVQVELGGANKANLKALSVRPAPTPEQQQPKATPKTQSKQ